MVRFIPAALWAITLYGLTIATSGLPVGPTVRPESTASEIQKSVVWFELNHAILHGATFAVLAGLLVFAHRRKLANNWQVTVHLILVTAILVGVGQEALQSAARARIVWVNSMFDIGCDVAGAAICLLTLSRRPKPA